MVMRLFSSLPINWSKNPWKTGTWWAPGVRSARRLSLQCAELPRLIPCLRIIFVRTAGTASFRRPVTNCPESTFPQKIARSAGLLCKRTATTFLLPLLWVLKGTRNRILILIFPENTRRRYIDIQRNYLEKTAFGFVRGY